MEIDNEHGMESKSAGNLQPHAKVARSVCLMQKLLLATLSTQTEACNSVGESVHCELETGNWELLLTSSKWQLLQLLQLELVKLPPQGQLLTTWGSDPALCLVQLVLSLCLTRRGEEGVGHLIFTTTANEFHLQLSSHWGGGRASNKYNVAYERYA